MLLLTREKLTQLSEEELENLYQQKKAEYDQKIAKNRRIRGLLQRKLDSKSEIVMDIQKKIDDLLVAHPEVVKQNFDDEKLNPEELRNLIQEKRESLSGFQAKKLNIERTITEMENHIGRQRALEERLQHEIERLYSRFDELSSDDEDTEKFELNRVIREINSVQDQLDSIHNEIEDIRQKIHQ